MANRCPGGITHDKLEILRRPVGDFRTYGAHRQQHRERLTA
jgi:hypothetical protein